MKIKEFMNMTIIQDDNGMLILPKPSYMIELDGGLSDETIREVIKENTPHLKESLLNGIDDYYEHDGNTNLSFGMINTHKEVKK